MKSLKRFAARFDCIWNSSRIDGNKKFHWLFIDFIYEFRAAMGDTIVQTVARTRGYTCTARNQSRSSARSDLILRCFSYVGYSRVRRQDPSASVILFNLLAVSPHALAFNSFRGGWTFSLSFSAAEFCGLVEQRGRKSETRFTVIWGG